MTKKDVTLFYGLILAVYSIGFVPMSAFSSLYLLDAGFSNGNVGVLLAVGSLLSVALQPVVGILIDKNKRFTSKKLLLILGTLIVLLGILLISIPNKSFATNALIYGTLIMLLMLGQPFMNSLGIESIINGYNINLGRGRSIGSLGYAIGSFGFGMISVLAGPKSVPIAFSLAFLVFLILLYLYPDGDEGVKSFAEKRIEMGNPFIFLTKYKRFSVILVGLIFIYFSHSLINVFALQIVVPKGGTSGDMGMASAIAAGCELITAFIFTWYMSKIKLNNIIKISGIFFTLKTLFSLLAATVPQFLLIQGFQMFGWGFMSVGIVYYVNELVGDEDIAQGQAYAGMSMTIANVLATSIGGNIIDMYGVNRMLIVGTMAAVLGTVILYFSVNDVKRGLGYS